MDIISDLRCPISHDLPLIRDLVREHAEAAGLTGERLDDLVLAVNEAVTNVLDHGGGAGTVIVRGEPGGLTVQIIDVADTLTDRHLAAADIDLAGPRGFGLWIIQHLCDRVDLDHLNGGTRLSLRMSNAQLTRNPRSCPTYPRRAAA